jgi:hypothetical protein
MPDPAHTADQAAAAAYAAETAEARADGRARRQRRRGGVKQLPWRGLTNPYRPIGARSQTARGSRMHRFGSWKRSGSNSCMTALDRLEKDRRQGRPRDKRVRMDRAMVLEHVARSAVEVVLHARNPGAASRSAGTMSCSPRSRVRRTFPDLDKGRRPGTPCRFQNPAHRAEPQHHPLDLRLSVEADRSAAGDAPSRCAVRFHHADRPDLDARASARVASRMRSRSTASRAASTRTRPRVGRACTR